jgi:hypothetical protein
MWTKDAITSRRRIKYRQKRLHRLTPAERAILRKYIIKDTRSQDLSLQDGVAQGLVLERIIYRPLPSIGDVRRGFPHNIQPWAWDYLKKHPELLKD